MQKLFSGTSKFVVGLLVVVFALSITLWMSCEKRVNSPVEPPTTTQEMKILSKASPQIQAVMAVQDRHTPDLMANTNVVGTATGLTADGRPAILVLTKEETTQEALQKGRVIPETIEGIPVVVRVTGIIRPLKGKPPKPPKTDHKAKQNPPIQLGTSGGWRYDLANGYCCGGTLGSLIQIGSKKYILSNYHVLEADIVEGGNARKAENGDPVIQPGLIDVGCNANNAQDVATLLTKSSLPDNNVDAAVAEIIPGMVDDTGAILEIGTLSAQTVDAFIGQEVKKSGRTTGLSRSDVNGLNATIRVTYDVECAGGTAFTITFTGQIVIANKGSKFLAGGDSGSLMVEDVDTNPGAVGLLFAGSRKDAIANPIDEVLSFLGASMVGN